MRFLPVAFIASFVMLLAGCGFQPLYDQSRGGSLGNLVLEQAENPLEVRFRNAFLFQNSAGTVDSRSPSLLLRFNIDEEQRGILTGRKSFDDNLRSLDLIVNYTLEDGKTVVDRGKVSASTAFRTSADRLQSDQAQNEARGLAVDKAAAQLALRLAAKIRR